MYIKPQFITDLIQLIMLIGSTRPKFVWVHLDLSDYVEVPKAELLKQSLHCDKHSGQLFLIFPHFSLTLHLGGSRIVPGCL